PVRQAVPFRTGVLPRAGGHRIPGQGRPPRPPDGGVLSAPPAAGRGRPAGRRSAGGADPLGVPAALEERRPRLPPRLPDRLPRVRFLPARPATALDLPALPPDDDRPGGGDSRITALSHLRNPLLLDRDFSTPRLRDRDRRQPAHAHPGG